jgi:signal peptidase I
MPITANSPLPRITTLTLILCLFAVSCHDRYKHYRIDSNVMEPTLKVGRDVRVDREAYKHSLPVRWEVIVFKHPSNERTLSAMRVIGLPGETVFINESGLMIDGARVQMPKELQEIQYIPLRTRGTRFAVDSVFTIPANSYFVLGDNSGEASDSRVWGALPLDRIVGKVER